MFGRNKNKSKKAKYKLEQRQSLFDTFRSMICSKDRDEETAFVLFSAMRPMYKRYTIGNTSEFINAKPVEFTLYLELESASELAELLSYHNMIDYELDENHHITFASNEENVYIYCPNTNVFVDFNWKDVSNLSDLSLKIMAAFGAIKAHKVIK